MRLVISMQLPDFNYSAHTAAYLYRGIRAFKGAATPIAVPSVFHLPRSILLRSVEVTGIRRVGLLRGVNALAIMPRSGKFRPRFA
jgi:hypothetical protein